MNNKKKELVTKVEDLLNNDTVKEVFNKIVIPIFLSLISVLLVFPLLLKWSFITNILKAEPGEYIGGIVVFNILIICCFLRKIFGYFKRYINTKRSGYSKILSADAIACYIIFLRLMILAIVLWGKDCEPIKSLYSESLFKKDFKISSQISIIVGINILLFLLTWFGSLLRGCWGKGEALVNEKVDNNVDAPITTMKGDKLRREQLIKDLADLILPLHDKVTESFSIGLYAGWGEGKTSVINLMIEHLKESDKFRKNFILIKFNPWQYQDEKSIMTGFYEELESRISEDFIIGDLKKRIGKYQKKISTGISLPGLNLNLNPLEESILDTKKSIEDYIKKTNKKFLIIIDDIDRLYPKEVLMVLKLVRINFDLKNTIFLLCLDPKIVGKLLVRGGLVEGEKYIEKIVNKSFDLPKSESVLIKNYLEEELNELLLIFKEVGLSDEEKKDLLDEFFSLFEPDITVAFKTLREVKRYISSISHSLRSLRWEINPFDFLLLHAIRVLDNEIYEDIKAFPDFYINPTKFADMFVLGKNDRYTNVEERKINLITAHFDSLLEARPHQELIKALFVRMFPDLENYLNKKDKYSNNRFYTSKLNASRGKRIYVKDYFDKYFILLVPDGIVSDKYIHRVICCINLLDDEFLFRDRLLFYREKDNNKFEFIINLFFKFTEEISEHVIEMFLRIIYLFPYIFKNSKNNLYYEEASTIFLELIESKFVNQNKQKLLENALLNTPDLYFAVTIALVLTQHRRAQNSYFSDVDIKHLQNIVLKRLEDYYIFQKKDIIEEKNESGGISFILYNWASNWEEGSKENTKKVKEYVMNIIGDNPQKLSEFLNKLKWYIGENFTWNYTMAGFCNLDKMKEMARENENNESLSIEGREVLKAFLAWLDASVKDGSIRLLQNETRN